MALLVEARISVFILILADRCIGVLSPSSLNPGCIFLVRIAFDTSKRSTIFQQLSCIVRW